MANAELILRVSGAGILAFFAILWWRDCRDRPAGPLGTLFCFGVASYLICPPMARTWEFGVFELPIFFGCFGAAVFLWLFSQALFDDGFRLSPWHGGVLLLAEGLGAGRWLARHMAPDLDAEFDLAGILLLAHQLLSLILIISALVLAYLGRAGDLVEGRRRFRLLLVGVSGIYAAIIVATEIYLRTGRAAAELELLNVALIDLVSFAFLIAATQLRPSLVPARAPTAAAEPAAPATEVEDPLLDALQSLMDEDKAYLQEGLTVKGLADRLSTQEYRLRRMINGRLGYRNFSEFLNSYRLAEARQRLADPDCARLPILTIAMDCGYASLGPFNRAFKQAAGMTPSEFRRRNLGDMPPKG